LSDMVNVDLLTTMPYMEVRVKKHLYTEKSNLCTEGVLLGLFKHCS
ncbi:MAG: hypothetical protein K0R05_2508, partial [Anaerocolumna sp.]|nr:hypothetical protein [Anaerocolumna sp.]